MLNDCINVKVVPDTFLAFSSYLKVGQNWPLNDFSFKFGLCEVFQSNYHLT